MARGDGLKNYEGLDLKDAKNEIELILARLEDKNLNLNDNQEDYKRLIYLNRHMENLFKKKL